MSRTPKTTTPDCRACGACCVSWRDQGVYCDLTDEDLRRLSKSWIRQNVEFPRPFDQLVAAIDSTAMPAGAIRTHWRVQRTGPLKDCSVCACVALRGSILSRVSCTIYDRRPEACRTAVVPGDSSCKYLRNLLTEELARCG